MSFNWFGLKDRTKEAVDGLSKNVDKVIPVAEKVIEQAGKVSESIATVTTNVASVAKSDNEVAIALHNEIAAGQGSFLTRNVRPIIALSSFVLYVLGALHVAPEIPLLGEIIIGYMGLRSVDKLGQMFSAASALKTVFGKK